MNRQQGLPGYGWIALVVLIAGALACNLSDSGDLPATLTPPPYIPPITYAPGVTPTADLNPVTVPRQEGCVMRTDWPLYIVEAGDSLSWIAYLVNTTTEDLTAANCLLYPDLIETGMALYVPSAPAVTTPDPYYIPTIAPPSNCVPPAGWVLYTVQPGDALSLIAASTGTTVEALVAANCLLYPDIIEVGMGLYVPILPAYSPPDPYDYAYPTNAPLPSTCVPPAGWVLYTVQPGDALSLIATSTGTTVEALMAANCLLYPDIIEVGMQLYVPALPTGAAVIHGFVITPFTVRPGQTATLTWSASGGHTVAIWRLSAPGVVAEPALFVGLPMQGSVLYNFPQYFEAVVSFQIGVMNAAGQMLTATQTSVNMEQAEVPIVHEFVVMPTTARAGDIVTFTWRVTGAESVTIWRLDPAGTPVNPPLGAGMPLQSAARYTFPAYYGTTVDFYLGAVSGGAIVAGARLSVTMPG